MVPLYNPAKPILIVTREGVITHQAVKIHITPMWTLMQRITHHAREYTTQDTKPQCGRYFWLSATETSKSTQPRGRLCFGPFLHQSGIRFGSKSRRRRSVCINIRNVDLRSLYWPYTPETRSCSSAHCLPAACCMYLADQTLRPRPVLI